MASPLPALRRDLEALPLEHEGQPMFLLQDREGLCEQALALSPGSMMIASLLDGRRTASEIQDLFAQSTGARIEISRIQEIVEQLDKTRLLETPEFHDAKRRALEEFSSATVRKAALQGAVYPQDTLELAKTLGAYLRDPKGPGKPIPDKPHLPAPLGLVSPHIDFQRGGAAYAWAYQALAESEPPDAVVALGVAHSGPNSPWVMTRKAYETPCGPIHVDRDLYEAIRGALWYDPLDDEWVHRREHSLEFQALWLKFLWREKAPPWVPILTSAFERFCPDRPPSSVETIEKAVSQIGRILAERAKGRRILILAGVDLAHVGPRFGDDIKLGPETERRIEREDRESLEAALNLDPDGFYRSVVADGHWRKVCGLSALYTALRWIRALSGDEPAAGKLLAYGQAPDPSGGIVSFASAIFPSASGGSRRA